MALRSIKSFVLRQGRMTDAQKTAAATLQPLYGIDIRTTYFDDFYTPEDDLTLEIGFGMGDSLFALAQAFPHKKYLGIEVHPPGIGRLLRLIETAGLTNLRVIQEDAILVLKEFIPDASLNEVQLFFPDPWPKKRHHKRRIVQPHFAQLIAQKLKPSGLFHLATDWQPYAEHMMEVLSKEPAFTNAAGVGEYSPRDDRPLSKFEQKGQQKGHAIFDLRFLRCP